MKGHSDSKRESLEGFVYRVPGPDGSDYRWIARSVHGHVAHGTTAESAAESLEAGMAELARASGQTLAEWSRSRRRAIPEVR